MSAFQKTGLSPLRGVDALPEDRVGPHDANMASCSVLGAALSDEVTIVSCCIGWCGTRGAEAR